MPALLLGRCTRLHPATLPVATTVLLWASAFPGIRAALQGFSPAGLASLRFTIAAVVLLIASLAIRPHWPRGRDLVRVALAGGVGITAYNIALNTGELTISAGAASFLVNVAPLFTALIAAATLGERVAKRTWFGMMFSLGGVGLIGLGESGLSGFGRGAALVLAAALLQAIYFVLQKPVVAAYSPFAATVSAVAAGAVLLAPSLRRGRGRTARSLVRRGLSGRIPSRCGVLGLELRLALPASRAGGELAFSGPANRHADRPDLAGRNTLGLGAARGRDRIDRRVPGQSAGHGENARPALTWARSVLDGGNDRHRR